MGKKVSLVLSSGGARGIAHIGIIEELEKRGYDFIFYEEDIINNQLWIQNF